MRLAVYTYAFIAMMTFGYAAADLPETRTAWRGGYTIHHNSLDRVFSGLFAGAAWPLYWTWTVFAKARGDA